ncbi:HEAT repeat domain-containing protein [uncultured Modestobacter sp.]|uniref:HEAT repeat domain-containing protein n=1 Tax=uncultured Modestobacter sp. TaxID=380048 RepID=UPI00262E23C8|nr:HEAT repeat domain-containing protein [uncultured Modestobacter sp.]
MDTTSRSRQRRDVAGALAADDPSVRLRAALAIGTEPDAGLLEALVERCAVEPDFFVRDMLSWALTRLPAGTTLPRIRRELGSEHAQARSQALHTLSKIGVRSSWAWITPALLRDPDDEVARAAWRAAVALVPEDGEEHLADELLSQLGRGGHGVQSSLSRALVDLGDVVVPALRRAAADIDPAVAEHARATELLLRDPEAGFEAARAEARRLTALGHAGAVATDGRATGC